MVKNILLLFLLHNVSTLNVRIDGNNGIDSIECLTGQPQSSCQSLKYVADTINNTSNLTIEIISPTLSLQGSVIFTDINGLTINGQEESLTAIQVQSVTAGISFLHCGEIVLANFTLNTVTESLLYDSHLISEDQCNFIPNGNYSLFFLNPKKLTIKNCNFTSSNDTHTALNGVLIELFNTKGTASISVDNVLLDKSFYNTLNIENTEFVNNRIGFDVIAIKSSNNSISVIASQFNENKYQGLKISYETSCSNNFMIFGCTFSYNTGCNGVSIDLALAMNSTSNIFRGIGSRFIHNSAKYAGGGVNINLSPPLEPITYPSNNIVIFQFCDFINNSGSYAGGVGIFNHNKASSGSAVHINSNIGSESGTFFVALVYFYRCNFFGNGQYHFKSRANELTLQSGAFYANKAQVNFGGKTQFADNNSTALQVSDTNIEFKDDSTTIFKNNSGIKGGAILLTGDSELYVKYNTSIIFNGNRAVSYGGAIAVLHLQCFGTFNFSARSIATPTKSLSVSQVINAIPDIPMKLNITAEDMFENDTSALFPLILTLSGSGTNSIRMNPHVITTNIHMTFYGNPHETTQLLIQTETMTSISVTAKLNLIDCPPGFIFNKTGFCFCSALSKNRYQEITANYWAGYLNISNASDDTFVTGHCSIKLCNYNNTKHKFGFYQLPIDYDQKKLDEI
uniref:Right handed beta helix domain-containing protein n=1 Tax=Amphimedon queenslandica TaxID=400682 RepID=A0A1X7SYS5_AMPQE